LKAIEQQTEEKSLKEAELERNVERLCSELKFKEHELTELHGMFMFYIHAVCSYVCSFYIRQVNGVNWRDIM